MTGAATTPLTPRLWGRGVGLGRGWNLKHLHRLIVTSAAYRLNSAAAFDHPNIEADPDNRFLWRMNARRMESEAVRDSVLAVAGELELRRGGPELAADLGQSTARRSIYYRHAPEKFMTFLTLFDAPSTTECYRRIETIVPQQALALVNSPLAIEQSRRLSARLNGALGTANDAATETAFINAAFERVLCRPPTDAERSECVRFLEDQTERLSKKQELTAFAAGGKPGIAAATEPYLRARENLVHVLFNHNEFVMSR
jgi:hypothetical protein